MGHSRIASIKRDLYNNCMPFNCSCKSVSLPLPLAVS